MERHMWYSDQSLVPICLTDQELGDDERENVDKVPTYFEHTKKLNPWKDLDFGEAT